MLAVKKQKSKIKSRITEILHVYVTIQDWFI